MKLEMQRVDAQTMGMAFSSDRDLQLPVRPRFIQELVAIPFADGVLCAGGEQLQMLRGRSARAVLRRLVPLLDGTRTLDALAAALPEMPIRHLRDAISLLHSRGLLEDGAPVARHGTLAHVGQFLGRFIDVARANGNRDRALARLASTTVGVVGRSDLAARAGETLAASGFGRVRHGAADADVNLVISTGSAPHRPLAGTRALWLRLGADEWHLGPYLIPGVTACPHCLERVHPHPAGEPDDVMAAYHVGVAVTQLTLAIAQIVVSAYPRGFQVVRRRNGELERDGRLATPLPGCKQCRVDGPPVAPDDPALVPWIYHAATALPGREFVAPRAHQMHYAVSNMELASEVRPPLLGAPLVALPPPTLAPSEQLTIDVIATILGRVGGMTERQGAPRRILPTGGNLGSVDFWLVARRVDGLAPGVYHYDGPRHQLEVIGDVDDATLAAALRTEAVPDAAIITTGALARCAQKYGNFTYRLVHLDSGVALSYAHAVSSALGMPAHEVDALDEVVTAELLGLHPRWDYPLPTGAFALGAWEAVSPRAPRPMTESAPLRPEDHSSDAISRLLVEASRPPHASTVRPAVAPIQSWPPALLDHIVFARRAVRVWQDAVPPDAMLRTLLVEARAMMLRRVSLGAPPCFVRPVLAVARDAEGLQRGLYQLAGDELVQIAPFDAIAMRECTNQEALALSPAALFMLGDLSDATTARGARGYREAAQHAGAAVGHVWLTATGLGLGGTAVGGVLFEGLRAVAGLDPRRACPLLGFHVGLPAPSSTVSA